jgi:hypothetical protein
LWSSSAWAMRGGKCRRAATMRAVARVLGSFRLKYIVSLRFISMILRLPRRWRLLGATTRSGKQCARLIRNNGTRLRADRTIGATVTGLRIGPRAADTIFRAVRDVHMHAHALTIAHPPQPDSSGCHASVCARAVRMCTEVLAVMCVRSRHRVGCLTAVQSVVRSVPPRRSQVQLRHRGLPNCCM